ncbi:hypothetical protein HanHA300_Chr05g0162611 [Helianthus annuus]|nr:hypothetical protein HanHA300_Chr05g0162611 [Helianthus annuus]KAJ0583434.1 hypothetical protein HanHA89_Chr05g0176501 [Helianthus annuus]KAJ0746169.1 hypothetical protein HanOQP8_Chr05g0174441 [Helianthus annuus]KAJ0749174.1 hypothetical protein HanLR1_Chr05g0166741 [Helianthus annuus]
MLSKWQVSAPPFEDFNPYLLFGSNQLVIHCQRKLSHNMDTSWSGDGYAYHQESPNTDRDVPDVPNKLLKHRAVPTFLET